MGRGVFNAPCLDENYFPLSLYGLVGSATLFRVGVDSEVPSLFSADMISVSGLNTITGALPIASESSISFLRVSLNSPFYPAKMNWLMILITNSFSLFLIGFLNIFLQQKAYCIINIFKLLVIFTFKFM